MAEEFAPSHAADLVVGALLGAVCAVIGFASGWAACDLSDQAVRSKT